MTNPTVKYPIGIQTFETIRNEGYIYVDKTEYVHKLVENGKYYFLARPRRFGKSLLLSTLSTYFEGKKELFEGLALYRLAKEWMPSPVLHLSLAAYNKCEDNSIMALLDTIFSEWENKYHIDHIPDTLSARFRKIILSAFESSGQRVVILIDEYDAPMVAHLNDDDNHVRIRNLLKSIYVNIKDMDPYIRFAMMTGVSRFSRTSIFSGLNNLKDITLDSEYSSICGITESELKEYFPVGIQKLAGSLATDYNGALAALKANYDGYHFTKKSPDIYNPFSLLNALYSSEIGSYWFATGTPTFLIEAIHDTDRFLPEYFTEEVEAESLSEIDTYRNDPLALMFQTGYLTIKAYDEELGAYRLGLPNLEVKQGLSKGLLQVYMNQRAEQTGSALLSIRRAFRDGKPDDAMKRVKSFLADIPYELAKGKDEIYFENNLYLLFNLIGVRTSAEYRTSQGRIDLLLEMPGYIYILELKLDGTAQEALDQIADRGYADPFRADPRTIYEIGVNFSRATRNIDTWLIEQA